MTINGNRSLVGLDTSTATLTATFPTVNQWITISPAPAAGTATTNLQQVELEKLILATVKVVPGGTSTSWESRFNPGTQPTVGLLFARSLDSSKPGVGPCHQSAVSG
jgi:hypothetical protein